MRIYQISDIHIGGDYNGRFKVKENFEKVISNIKKTFNKLEGDQLIVTGDLVDCDRENYKEVQSLSYDDIMLATNGENKKAKAIINKNDEEIANYHYINDKLKCFGSNKVKVICGNHDNPELLANIFRKQYFDNPQYTRFNSLHKCMKTSFVCRYYAFLDTKDGFVHDEDLELLKEESPLKENKCKTIITHYPIDYIDSKFMNKYELKDRQAIEDKLYDLGFRYNICGHYHHSFITSGKIKSICCPSTQCEIDPNSCELKTKNHIGYSIINIGESGNSLSANFSIV